MESMEGEASVHFFVHVYAGDRPNTGTEGSVQLVMHGQDGQKSDSMDLLLKFKEDFKRGSLHASFPVPKSKMGSLTVKSRISRIELSKEKAKDVTEDSPHWHLDKIVIENDAHRTFPVFSVIKDNFHRQVNEYDTYLPQDDPFTDQRKKELVSARQDYRYCQKYGPDGPVTLEELPDNEKFSIAMKADKCFQYIPLATQEAIMNHLPFWHWNSVDDIKKVYTKLGCLSLFPTPDSVDHWTEDTHFGMQRVRGINPRLLSLIKDTKSIPENFPVTNELLEPILGMSMETAIVKKRLFMINLAILKDIPVKENFVLCAPMALFFEVNDELRPVAIQLFQEPNPKSPENPIFTPNDPEYTWTLAKCWYNNADAAYQQAWTHLGQTHLLSEGIAVSVHRNLSHSHPVFKLMAPHFLYVMAINDAALGQLINDGGLIDKVMNYGNDGFKKLVCKAFSSWRMNVEGTLPRDLGERGLDIKPEDSDETTVLNCYEYRNDAILLYNCIRKYVNLYINHYYTSQNKLTEDWEIQDWAADLVKPLNGADGGLGLAGVPGRGQLSSNVELIRIVSSVIFMCSVTHAAANYPAYEEYGFPPNYPMSLRGDPPTDKKERTEEDLMKALPDKKTTLDIMTITKNLSNRTSNPLGDFEVNYIHDPEGQKIVDVFRLELKKITATIKERNITRSIPYTTCMPELIPNSVSS